MARSASLVPDLDLARLGRLGHGDREREHSPVVVGLEVVEIQILSEQQLTETLPCERSLASTSTVSA